MKNILLLSIVLSVGFCIIEDEAFIKKYSVVIHKRGTATQYPNKGDQVTVHYTGTLLDGKKFDSSKDRGQPFQFTLGRNQVITCWDEVVARLTVGDQVTVTCPSATAYGSRGAGAAIPPNSDIKFDIDMLKFRDQSVDL